MSFPYTHSAESVARAVRDIVREAQRKNVSFMAGSIAYSAFVSLLPLVLLLVIAASVVGGESLVRRVRGVTGSYLSPTGQSLLEDSISQVGSQTGLSILGIAVLFWGVFRVLRALDTAFSAIYDTQQRNDLPSQIKDGAVVLVALGAALLAVLAAATVLRFVPNLPFPELVRSASLILALSFVFLPVFYVFPDADLSLGMVLPGAVVAAIGWTFLNAIFGIYVAYSSTQELYGVIGGVILFITFLYFSALVILIGATTNAVLMGRRPSTSTETVKGS